MKKGVYWFIPILLFVLLLTASTAVAKETRPRGEPEEEEITIAEENELEVDITGYGDILFGSTIRDLDVTRIPIDSSFGIESARYWIVNDESYQAFTILDKTFDARTFVGSLDNSTVATVSVSFSFPLTMNLDEISFYVEGVRFMYIDKYPQLPIFDDWVWDYDSYHTDWWVGDLEIHDQDGDLIWVHWDGYSLWISYRNVEYQQALWDSAIENIMDQAEKI